MSQSITLTTTHGNSNYYNIGMVLKVNSDLKTVKLRLKTDLVSHFARREILVNTCVLIGRGLCEDEK